MAERAKAVTPRRSEPSARNEQDAYATFEASLRQILSVPRSEIAAKISDERRARKGAKQTSRVSRARD